jgi:hypothetical protein
VRRPRRFSKPRPGFIDPAKLDALVGQAVCREHTVVEIAEACDVHPKIIRRIEANALRKLKRTAPQIFTAPAM